MKTLSRDPSLRTLKKTVNPHSVKNLHPWKKGESGNPDGRPKRKPVLEALHAALTDHPELLKRIALNALRRASCDHRFFSVVRDMLDGKPVQQCSGLDEAAIPLTIEEIDEEILRLIATVEEREAQESQ